MLRIVERVVLRIKATKKRPSQAKHEPAKGDNRGMTRGLSSLRSELPHRFQTAELMGNSRCTPQILSVRHSSTLDNFVTLHFLGTENLNSLPKINDLGEVTLLPSR